MEGRAHERTLSQPSSAPAVWMVMWAEVLAFMLRGKNGFWSPSRQASVPRKQTHADTTCSQGAGRLCPGPAARSRVSLGQCPRPAHCHGAGEDQGEQCLAELSPQGLLTEEEGRRGQRLTCGTGSDARAWCRQQIAEPFLSTSWKWGCGACRYCRASLPHGCP